MDRLITDNEIRYLLQHLSMFYSGTDLAGYMITDTAGTGIPKPSIHFPLSQEPLHKDRVIYLEEIPVLFPCSQKEQWYLVDGKQVSFHHDILKSAFYLLSGYQENQNKEQDEHGRFPWKHSVQYLLGFTQKPLVNYYFHVILDAFEQFCQLNALEFRRNQMEAPLLFLSHDVDMIRKYSLRNLAYAGLQLVGLKPSEHAFQGRLRNLAVYARGFLFCRKDPYWNFREMVELEKELGISSTWYFLEKTGRDNSRYLFGDHRIRELMEDLLSRGHEVGIHGTLESSGDPLAMKGGIERLNKVCGSRVQGIRQHYLKYSLPATTRIQDECGLSYDSTLGFAEQIGFRNSFAHPFRLYDFHKGKPFGLWQLPLNVMEVSLLGYMKVPPEAIPGAIGPVMAEIKKFQGVFSLLWHNSSLDEEELPGIGTVYKKILQEIMDSGFRSLTGYRIIEAIRSGDVSDKNRSAGSQK